MPILVQQVIGILSMLHIRKTKQAFLSDFTLGKSVTLLPIAKYAFMPYTHVFNLHSFKYFE